MKKSLFIFWLTACYIVSNAQQIDFEFAYEGLQPNIGIINSSQTIADVDGDGDPDILVTGTMRNDRNVELTISKFFINKGRNLFVSEKKGNVKGVTDGEAAFADVDGDGDADLLITGRYKENNNWQYSAKLYINDGTGYFTEMNNTPFTGVAFSDVAFADVDGDNDLDVMIAGQYPDGTDWTYTTRLYLNNGNGSFTPAAGNSFTGISNGDVAFADVDGDGDMDVMISGYYNDGSSHYVTLLYTNDGQGHFTLVSNTPFRGVSRSAIGFSDVNGDGALDVMVTGSYYDNQQRIYSAKLYVNDGQGGFTEMPSTPFQGVEYGDLDFADIDGDGDEDVMIIGRYEDASTGIHYIAKLYVKNRYGNFEEVSSTPFQGIDHGDITFFDTDGDGDRDLFMTGYYNDGTDRYFSGFYLNDGNGHFEAANVNPFKGSLDPDMAIGDLNGDGFNDFCVVAQYALYIYLNDTTGDFNLIPNVYFASLHPTSVAIADTDGDGDNDLLVAGSTHTYLFENDGNAGFTQVQNTPFTDVNESDAAFADVDGDGDPDLVLSGISSQADKVTYLYKNLGSNRFVLVTEPFRGMSETDINFSDVDGDGDLDLLIAGEYYVDINMWHGAFLYINDGTGSFTEMQGTPFRNDIAFTAAFGDVEGDGDMDLLLSTMDSTTLRAEPKLYLNDGTGHFSIHYGMPFQGGISGDVAFVDLDADGDPDVVITGRENGNGSQYRMDAYQNMGSGNFYPVDSIPFYLLGFNNKLAFGDMDNDGDPDMFVSGRVKGFDRLGSTVYYRNVSVTTAVEENTFEYPVSIYPNPAKDYLILKMQHPGNYNILLADMSGQEIFSTHTNRSVFKMPLRHVKSGIYILRIVEQRSGRYVNARVLIK